jgi:hypothetical protein
MARFVILGAVVGFAVAMLLLRHPEPAQAPAAPPSTGVGRLPATPTELQGKIALTHHAQFPTPINEPLRGPDAGAWVAGPR